MKEAEKPKSKEKAHVKEYGPEIKVKYRTF